MSHRRAKRIRQGLLPRSGEEGLGSRGEIIRTLTKYIPKDNGVDLRGFHRRDSVRLALDCPKAVIQRAKRYAR